MGIQCCIGFEALDLAGKWETLKQLQTRYTYRAPSHKFKDSPYLKSLCMDRRCCSDAEHKAVLTRAIVARRAHEKADWLQKLEHSASSGNAYAIRYLRKRVRHPSPWDGLVRDAGSKSAAAVSIQTHFQKLFQPPVPLEDQEACDCIMCELQLAASSEALRPFTWPEVAAAVNRLKLGKSTGMTGISCELISAMWQVVPEGQNMVVSFCNSLLQEEQHPPELHQSLVALLPKLPVIQATSQIRPINLVEVCHKMYSFLLLQRLRPTWPSPAAQHGAVRGGQVLDALASAHWWIAHESISQMHGRVWLNADLTAAFDSLCHRSLLQFVQAHTQDGCHHEALRLMQIVMRPQLHFIWQQFQWDMGQSSGVQQGHSHSAILFAYVVGHILEDLFKEWRERGEDTTTRDWGWLFVDDLLCSFDSWTQARKLVPEIVEAFGRAGLSFSLKKSEVMCTPQTLEEGKALDWDPNEFLYSIPWTSCTKYLRKPLTHFQVGDSTYTVLLPTMKQRVHLATEQLRQVVKGLRWHQPYMALRLVNRYVGATIFWYLPLMFPTTAALQTLLTLQVSVLVIMLRLFIPEHVSHDTAMFLHRLRRRCVLLFVGTSAKYGWHCIWRQRLWKDVASSVHLALKTLDASRRPRGGVVTTPMSWLRGACKLQYPDANDLSFSAIAALASDRDRWHTAGERHLTDLNSVERHSHLHQTTHQKWQLTVLQVVPWAFSVALVFSAQGEWKLVWVDEERGLQQLSLGSELQTDDFVSLVKHCQMQYSFLVVNVSLTQHHLDSHLAVISRAAEGLLEMSTAASFEVVPDEWHCRFQGLL